MPWGTDLQTDLQTDRQTDRQAEAGAGGRGGGGGACVWMNDKQTDVCCQWVCIVLYIYSISVGLCRTSMSVGGVSSDNGGWMDGSVCVR